MGMRRWWLPIFLLFAAAVLLCGSFAWAVVTGVVIPDQDPTPAMEAHFRFHSRIVDEVMTAAVGSLLAAIISALVLVVARWHELWNPDFPSETSERKDSL